MKSTRVHAEVLRPEVVIKAPGIERTVPRSLVLTEVETASGVKGYGITGLAPSEAVTHLINTVAAPLVPGLDSRANAAVWNGLSRDLGHHRHPGPGLPVADAT